MKMLQMTPLHFLSWCATCMCHFLDACVICDDSLVSLYNTLVCHAVLILKPEISLFYYKKHLLLKAIERFTDVNVNIHNIYNCCPTPLTWPKQN